jgi:hypothetical protein
MLLIKSVLVAPTTRGDNAAAKLSHQQVGKRKNTRVRMHVAFLTEKSDGFIAFTL